jgi:hypothetical protein
MINKPKLRIYDATTADDCREALFRSMLAGDDYTIRLWNAEAKLAELGLERGRDGFWRKRITVADYKKMQEMKNLGEDFGY